MKSYCMKCMHSITEDGVCPHCGFHGGVATPPHILPPGTILNGRYLLGVVLGQGGFGITYIGRDLQLDTRIAIKEYYPSGFANRSAVTSAAISILDTNHNAFIAEGKSRFLEEARSLAKFRDNPGVVSIWDFFEANNTAYIVMDYLEGEDLRQVVKTRRFSSDEIFRKMEPVIVTLEEIHKAGVIHRDISPDNIMLMDDGSMKLMDFGAARFVNFTDQRSISVLLKPGYAPEEQYLSTSAYQGPWTDIYALCATIYKCITGITPPDALVRGQHDSIKWPSQLGIRITQQQEYVLKMGMALARENRFQTLAELRAALQSREPNDAPHVDPLPRRPPVNPPPRRPPVDPPPGQQGSGAVIGGVMGGIVLLLVVVAVALSGAGRSVSNAGLLPTPNEVVETLSTPTPIPTLTAAPTQRPTPTPGPTPTPTPTPTLTPTPSAPTSTPIETPHPELVDVTELEAIYIRAAAAELPENMVMTSYQGTASSSVDFDITTVPANTAVYVYWFSTDERVATVDQQGVVTLVGLPGEKCNIIAQAGGLTASLPVEILG